MEEWKNIPNYVGWYQVSNLGRIKRVKYKSSTHPQRILKPYTKPNGYQMHILCKNGEHEAVLVHQVVLRAFIGPCPPKHQVNHKNCNKSDNRLENLEYLTARQNIRHAIKHGTYNNKGSRNPNAKLDETIVKRIRQEYQTGQKTCSEIATELNMTPGGIHSVLNGDTWKHVC